MTSQAANAFLKSLEEPPPNSVIIMTTENPDKLLPTIVSRTQAVQFGSIKQKEIMEHLINERGIDQEKALNISQFSAGKIGQAISISSEIDSFHNDQDFLKEFDLIVSEGSIYEKIRYAEKNGSEKEATENRFDVIELYYQQRILRTEEMDQGLKIAQILDKIAQSREFLNKNVNPRLVWENILLARGSDD
jgi:DNA polymerase-3 subunit delta'